MRRVLVLLGIVLLLVAAFYGVVLLASESGEVVTVTTRDGEGRAHATRIWIVDHDGAEWVRTGHAGKGWFQRARQDPVVELDRAGVTSRRTAVPVLDPAVARGVNASFARKYGAADWIVALSGDAAQRIVVRLDPAPAGGSR